MEQTQREERTRVALAALFWDERLEPEGEASLQELAGLVETAGGEVVGVGSIVDRTGGAMDFGVPFCAALSMEVASYEPDSCPICKTGAPLVKPGSRKLTK